MGFSMPCKVSRNESQGMPPSYVVVGIWFHPQHGPVLLLNAVLRRVHPALPRFEDRLAPPEAARRLSTARLAETGRATTRKQSISILT